MKNKRRRRKPQRKSSNTLYWVVGIVVGVVLIALLGQSLFAPATDGAVAASQLIDPSQYVEQFGDDESHLLLDVRTPEEFNSGHIEGAVNINVETLASRLEEVPRDMPIVVYCRSGNRSATASQILVNAGYQPVYDMGGIQTWVAQGFPVE